MTTVLPLIAAAPLIVTELSGVVPPTAPPSTMLSAFNVTVFAPLTVLVKVIVSPPLVAANVVAPAKVTGSLKTASRLLP